MSIETSSFLLGFLLALGLILPLGQQNMFILTYGSRSGKFISTIPVVMTAGLCDTLLITLSALGLSLLFLESIWISSLIKIIGILFLLYIGLQNWRENFSGIHTEKKVYSLKKRIFLTASFSLLNPHAIIDTMAIIGGNYLAIAPAGKKYFLLACILVSWLWFLFLSIVGVKLSKLTLMLKYQGKVSAIIMWLCAIYLGYQFF